MVRQKRKKGAKRTVPTKPIPRRSVGGRLPRAIRKEDQVRHFNDHTGATYTVVSSPAWYYQEPSVVRKLGVHLYCLDTPEPSPDALAFEICSQSLPDDRFDPRVDVYTDYDSIEQCISHHQRERVFRQEAAKELRRIAVDGMNAEDAYDFLTTQLRGKEPLPHIVPTWCSGIRFWREGPDFPDRYRSWILVTKEGCKSWTDVQAQGILLVRFDLDWHIEMETLLVDEDPASDSLIPDDNQPWPIIDKIERPPPISIELLCVRKEPKWHWTDFRKADGSHDLEKYTRFHDNWRTPGSQGALLSRWEEFSHVIRGCAYKDPCCDGCRDGVPHDRCEWELDEHYFDDEGQCIACRRKDEYRRRSKRLANKIIES